MRCPRERRWGCMSGFWDSSVRATRLRTPRLQWHLREFILPGLALYELLRNDGNSQEAALAMVNKIC